MPLIRDLPPRALSPYLAQHVDNPVDWYPWGEDAFERAEAEDRPIFLSIGYSACHWCHVMAHESFEDPATARVLNASFVSVKVDREERPDVDAVYMEAVQSLTGSGGWPMSMFLMPDRRPFFGGTYYPPDDRPGTPSFTTVLHALTDAWRNQRSEVERHAVGISEAIAQRSIIQRPPGGAASFDPGRRPVLPTPLGVAVDELARRFDATWGGFGGAPKFPQPTLVDLALVHAQDQRGTEGGDRSLQMAVTTLDAMAAGGIHDHVGGGFARYSTDHQWLVPHFEKMLYDQAGLLRTFLHGWQATGRPEYLEAMTGIVGYVSRDLTAPEGGVYSAEDADSEGVEGKFYMWTPGQITDAVTDGLARGPGLPPGLTAEAVAEALTDWFGVTEGGNFEGQTILRRPVGGPLVGSDTVELGRRLLFTARAGRVRPGLDDKVITEWNAMYASALAEAAGATGDPGWRQSALTIGEFLVQRLRDDRGRWFRSWRADGGGRHLACAADYAWLIDCFTRLAELSGMARWTTRATEAADGLLSLFHDNEGGGFFTTGHDAEALIVRTKDMFDGAMPSANAVAALSLARLGALTGIDRYTVAAHEVVDLFGELLSRHPTAFAHTVLTAELLSRGLTEVVVTGDRPDLVDVVRARWIPGAVLAWGEPTPSPLWEGRDGNGGLAYVCRNYVCRLPADDAGTLSGQLAEAVR